VSDPLGGLEPSPVEEPLPRPQPPPQKRPFTPATVALLGIFAAFFLAEGLVGHDPSVSDYVALIRLGALFGPALHDGDWWRIGSYAFLHIGWLHIFANSWSLWVLGPQLELTFGSNLTLGMFAATALAGGAASAAWNAYLGHEILAAGASGGIMGLFGATIALFWRIRANLPPQARRGIVRAIAINVLIMLVIAWKAPVDNAAHAGGIACGLLLGLLAPLRLRPPKPWHQPVAWLIIASTFVLAAMEGAAVARAVRPKPRTLRGAGVEAQVPGLLFPVEPGTAALPGEAAVIISRDDQPLTIEKGEDAVHIGDRTWVRETETRDGWDHVRLATSDGSGRLWVDFACGADFCRGEQGQQMVELVARTIRTIH
jgi:rhomboid protease GluP